MRGLLPLAPGAHAGLAGLESVRQMVDWPVPAQEDAADLRGERSAASHARRTVFADQSAVPDCPMTSSLTVAARKGGVMGRFLLAAAGYSAGVAAVSWDFPVAVRMLRGICWRAGPKTA